MIVKDEEKDIERCLKSVYKYIDYWVIIDTGSKDKTIKKIKSLMKNRFKLPGELHERPWVDFSHNRNESLEIAETKADYVMFMDADDIFKPQKEFSLDLLSEDYDCYYGNFRLDIATFRREFIVRSNCGFRYHGVMHETLLSESVPSERKAILYSAFIEANASPLKRFPTKKEKYLNDAKILEEDIKKNPENARNWFYLGQCYGDAGEHQKAIDAYKKRTQMEGVTRDEVYLSFFRIGSHKVELGCEVDEVLKSFSLAWEYMPYKWDAPAAIMSILVKEGRNFMAFSYGEMTLHARKVFGTTQNLFDIDVTENDMFPRYYGIAAEKCGFYETAISAYRILLKNNPPSIKKKDLEEKVKELELKCLA
jgi:glycosyltransferase involved in cell wall biosynthesis